MKKTAFLIGLFCGALAPAQTVTISISGVAPTVIVDIRTHWLDQASAPVGTVGAIDDTSASVTVTLSQASLTSAQALPVVGQSVVVGGEPMVIAAVDGLNLTLTRGGLPMAVLSAHPSGSVMTILRYASPWEMLSTEALRPWIQSIFAQLGARSMTLSGTATGTVGQ